MTHGVVLRTFLVGGAVRDQLLGLEPKDRDFVVLDVSPDELLKQGFHQVGKSFPVFLKDGTSEQYSLPRGKGNSLKDDLGHRDLTINSMAMNLETGEVIDPFGGKEDLQKKLFRMTSEAFFEDDIRILRLARFCAQLPEFKIETETLNRCRNYLSKKSALDWQSERVFVEWRKGLSSQKPLRMIEALDELGLLPLHFPELENMKGLEQRPDFHPEGDVWIHTKMVFEHACRMSNQPEVRYAALVHDLGKTCSPTEQLPSHKGHETRGLKLVNEVTSRFGLPNIYRELGLLVCEFHLKCHKIFEMRPVKVVKLFNDLDAFRKEKRFKQFLLCCEADDLGKLRKDYPPKAFLEDCFHILKAADTSDLIAKYSGKKLGEQIQKRYEKMIADIKSMP